MQGGVPRLLFPAAGTADPGRARPPHRGWLKEAFDLDADFEVDDALAKLDRLGLLRRDGERLAVPPPEDALARLDTVWDNYFQYNKAAAAS